DYAIMEKASDITCVPLSTSWSDVGSWSELWSYLEKDAQGNVVRGEGKIHLQDAKGNYAYSDHASLALVGVENLVIVVMGDVVLVASKDCAEAIKSVVKKLKGSGEDVALQHRRGYRPGGWYEGGNRGERYQGKGIIVKPGGIVRLPSHPHRAQPL